VAHAERGARFLVWLPCAPGTVLAVPAASASAPPPPAPPAPAPPPPAQATKVSLAGIRVLLVDDEELIRRPMARFLGKRGRGHRGGDGLAALERIRGGFEPQVILADLRMLGWMAPSFMSDYWRSSRAWLSACCSFRATSRTSRSRAGRRAARPGPGQAGRAGGVGAPHRRLPGEMAARC